LRLGALEKACQLFLFNLFFGEMGNFHADPANFQFRFAEKFLEKFPNRFSQNSHIACGFFQRLRPAMNAQVSHDGDYSNLFEAEFSLHKLLVDVFG